MDIRKIILAAHLPHMDRKRHIKNFIKETEVCIIKDDYINLLENWNWHEPERVVEHCIDEFNQYDEEKINIHIAWSLRTVEEVTGVKFTIDYIDTYEYPAHILDAHEHELFAEFN